MKKYLIMKCEELGDQWECDADRTPVCLVDNWQKWTEENRPDYQFEVYEFVNDKECTCIKEYDEALDEGMALYYWEGHEDLEEDLPHVMKKWPGRTRQDKIPEEVKEMMDKGMWDFEGDPVEDVEGEIHSFGAVTWFDIPNSYEVDGARMYVYGSYEDYHYSCGY